MTILDFAWFVRQASHLEQLHRNVNVVLVSLMRHTLLIYGNWYFEMTTGPLAALCHVFRFLDQLFVFLLDLWRRLLISLPLANAEVHSTAIDNAWFTCI